MAPRAIKFHIFLMFHIFHIFTIEVIANNNNETSLDGSRKSRVTGRIVKLYSGTKPEPILCTREGFKADTDDCSAFYRCMKSGNGKYTVFKFQCGPGTVYDPETEVCNYPKNTKRSECKEFITTSTELEKDNEIDRTYQEIPFPITTERLLNNDQITTVKTSLFVQQTQYEFSTTFPLHNSISTNTDSIFSTPAYPTMMTTDFSESSKVTISASKTTNSFKPSVEERTNICTFDGFMGDSENCQRFYRCVANGRGGYTRYEFSCSETTIWDDDVQSCNHPWAVKRSKCGRNNDKVKVQAKSEKQNDLNKNVQQQVQISHGSKVIQTPSQIGNRSVIQNLTQISYGDRISKNKASGFTQNQKQLSYESAISQTQTQAEYYGHKGAQTQVQIDHAKQTSQIQSQLNNPITQGTSVSYDVSEGSSINKNIICTQPGFIGDSTDCKKFYRCIDNGNGNYKRFEFSCGQGTVWDQKIEACNHAWAVKECGANSQTGVNTQTSYTSTLKSTESYFSTKPTQIYPQSIDNINEEVSYGNINHQPTSTTVSKTSTIDTVIDDENGYGVHTQQPTTIFPITVTLLSTTEGLFNPSVVDKPPGVGSECNTSGFMGDENDCKVFYRCIKNGRGFIKYEFKCGEGTVWDSNIEACNHAWAVEKCGGSVTNNINKLEGTTIKHTTQTTSFIPNVDLTTTTSKPLLHDNEDYDVGYGPHDTEFTTLPTTIKPPLNLENNTDNVCKSSGFIGDKNDCKRFYRCIDDGSGSFIRYEFTCGEATVWDQNIKACNHAWAVKKCGSNGFESENYETTLKPQTSSTIITTSTNADITNIDMVISSSSTIPNYLITTTTSKPINDNVCIQSGFMGDTQNCKKFYRCVDTGNGSYTRYEFSCGEGTVWDPNIEACNHAWAVEKCGGNIDSSDYNQSSEPPSYSTVVDTVNDKYPPNEEHQESETEMTSQVPIVLSTTEKVENSTNYICKNSGFIGDKNNCKKFYRCVDDGNGSFIHYEFKCGEGTLWDQSIEACNHAWAVKDCNKESSNFESMLSTTSIKPTTSESLEQHAEASSTTDNNNKPLICNNEGFYGDPNDCKRFYRCVDNGKGIFIKYNFSCGGGTVWNQKIQSCDYESDNNKCSSNFTPNYNESSATPSEIFGNYTSTESQYSTEKIDSSSSSFSGDCKSEGFFTHPHDCKKFIRCVVNDKKGYDKYEFSCGEGTLWVQDILACDYDNGDINCTTQSQSTTKPEAINGEQSGENYEGTSTTGTLKPQTGHDQSSTFKPIISQDSSLHTENKDNCTVEGYFGNTKDCKKFYRCVDDGRGGYIKYDFTCGEGTIWDQDVITCNYPQDVVNPTCNQIHDGSSVSITESTSSSSTSATSQSTSSTSQPLPSSSTSQSSLSDNSTMESTTLSSSNCSQEESSKKPVNENVNCSKEGFYPNPNDCKKFYRCVDWDGNSTRFSVYYFECGEGTIWDPALNTCNHEESVYPPRNCNGTQSQATEGTTTVKEEYSINETTTSLTSTIQSSTTDLTTTIQTTSQQSLAPDGTTSTEQITQQSTTEKTTTQQSTTSEQTTTQQVATTEQTSTQQSPSSELATVQQTTISDQTTTQQSTTSEQMMTQNSTDSQQTTTEQVTTSKQTSEESTTSEQTTEQSTTEQSMTSESSTIGQNTSTTTEESNIEEPTTNGTEQTTTEETTSDNSTSPDEGENSIQKECPDIDDDQYMFVCPTSFRRHPKYCNMFYQCTEDDAHEVQVATFTCPNNTIYDENQTKCVDESNAGKKCDGKIVQRRRYKKFEKYHREPIIATTQSYACYKPGYYSFDNDSECSPAFLRCKLEGSNKLRGYVYKCPAGYFFWSISKRCEAIDKIKDCKRSTNNWNERWEIPVERMNVALNKFKK